MRILITGVAGLLGSHLAEKLIQQGHSVIGIDNLVGGDYENVPEEVEFYEIDCIDLKAISPLFKDVDVVYHCACTAHEGLSVFSPNFITRNTFQITVSVITAAIQNKVKRFIYCSSMARYGKQDKIFTEDMEPKPQDPYGISKYAGELLLKNLAETHGMEYVIVIPHNIIGPRQKYDDPFRNVVSIMINRMLQGQQPIIYGDGSQIRSFSFVDDVTEPMIKMIGAASGSVYNIGQDKQEVSIKRLAEVIAAELDFKLDPIFVLDRPKEVWYANCSSDKARDELDYHPYTGLKDGVRSMIEYIKKMGPKQFVYHIDLEINSDLTPKTWKERMI